MLFRIALNKLQTWYSQIGEWEQRARKNTFKSSESFIIRPLEERAHADGQFFSRRRNWSLSSRNYPLHGVIEIWSPYVDLRDVDLKFIAAVVDLRESPSKGDERCFCAQGLQICPTISWNENFTTLITRDQCHQFCSQGKTQQRKCDVKRSVNRSANHKLFSYWYNTVSSCLFKSST